MDSKLDTMDSRIQNQEDHLLPHPPSSPHHTHDPTDPKGKGPMTSPPHTSPILVISHSSSSSSSSSSSHSVARFELTACITTAPTSIISQPSSDSDATHSDPPPPPPPPAPAPSPPKASSLPHSLPPAPIPEPSPPHDPIFAPSPT